MSHFYDRHHRFLHIFYKDAQSWWGRETDEFPDLEEITAFSLMISENPPTGEL
jgi:hypothetical protein